MSFVVGALISGVSLAYRYFLALRFPKAMKRFVVVASLLCCWSLFSLMWHGATAPGRSFVGYVYNPADGAVIWRSCAWDGWGMGFRDVHTGRREGVPSIPFPSGSGPPGAVVAMPLTTIYHIARLLGGVFLLAALGWLCQNTLAEGQSGADAFLPSWAE